MVVVGNLGGYQILTTVIKRLGGPTKAAVKIGSAFAALIGGTYFWGEKNGKKKVIAEMRRQAGSR